jgi:hypothetical protein
VSFVDTVTTPPHPLECHVLFEWPLSVVGEIEVKHQCIRASKSYAQACWWNWPLGQVLWFDWATALDEGGLIGLAMDLVVLASAALKKANDYFLQFEKNPITKFGLKYSLIEIYEWLFSNYRCVFNWPRNYFLPLLFAHFSSFLTEKILVHLKKNAFIK